MENHQNYAKCGYRTNKYSSIEHWCNNNCLFVARGGLEYKIPYKNGHLSLYESRRTISDISTARSFCEGRGALLASGVPEATLQNVTRTKRGMRDAWINDCYTRTEWLNGKHGYLDLCKATTMVT